MKKLLFLLLLTFIVFNSPAQIALKVYQFRPSGDFGFVEKRTFSAELLVMGNFDNHRFRNRLAISYVPLQARLDTFPLTGIVDNTLFPGYIVYSKFRMYFLTLGFDWGILDNDNWTPYLGMDIMVGGRDIEYSKWNGYEHKDYSGGEFLGGLRFRAGVEYFILKRYGLFIELARGMYLLSDESTLAHNDFGFGLHYKLND